MHESIRFYSINWRPAGRRAAAITAASERVRKFVMGRGVGRRRRAPAADRGRTPYFTGIIAASSKSTQRPAVLAGGGRYVAPSQHTHTHMHSLLRRLFCASAPTPTSPLLSGTR
jgi:hypothetical protein